MAEEAKKKLPKTVFVRREQDGDENYLCIYEEENGAVDDDGEVAEVGVYELKRTKRMRKVAQEV
jgi:hypothetical protein